MTSADSPPDTAESTIRFSPLLPVSGNSRAPRSTPVVTTPASPTAADTAATSPPKTPRVSKRPGCPESRSASEGAKNSAASRMTCGASAIPEIRYGLTRPCAATGTVSPTASPSPASTTTSPGFGACPLSVYGVRTAESHAWPSTLVAPTCAGKVTSPTTFVTPGTARRRSASAASSRTRSGRLAVSDLCLSSGSRVAGSSRGSWNVWCPPTTIGAAASRCTGVSARMPVSIRPPHAEMTSAPKNTATNVARKPPLRRRRVRNASLIITPPPGPIRRGGSSARRRLPRSAGPADRRSGRRPGRRPRRRGTRRPGRASP